PTRGAAAACGAADGERPRGCGARVVSALVDFLLAAPAERPCERPAVAAPAPLVRGAGVLAGGGDAVAAGAAVAIALARRCGAGCALVCAHDPGAAGPGL